MKKGSIILWTAAALLVLVFAGFLILQPWTYRALPLFSEYSISYGMTPEQVGRRLGSWTDREESAVWSGTSYTFQTELLGAPADMQLDFHNDRALTRIYVTWECETFAQAEELVGNVEAVFQKAYGDSEGFSREAANSGDGAYTVTIQLDYDGATGQYYTVELKGNTVTVSGIHQE